VIRYIKSRILLSLNKEQTANIDSKKVKKILVLKYDKIGDMVIATPIFRELKENLPWVKLTVLASNVNKPIIENNPYIDEIFVYSNKWSNLFPTLLKLRKRKFDVCFEFEAGVVSRSILITKIVKPKYVASVFKQHGRYGLSKDKIKLYDFYTNYDISNHRSLNLIDVLNFLNIKAVNTGYDLHLSDDSKRRINNFLKSYDSQSFRIGLNLEGVTFGGRIDNERIRAILEGINQDFEVAFFILAPPWEKDSIEILINEIGIKNIHSTYFDIKDLQTFISNLHLVISVDTSVVHLASAFKIPTVAIYANDKKNFSQWHPNNPNSRVVFSRSEKSSVDFDASEVVIESKEIIADLIQ